MSEKCLHSSAALPGYVRVLFNPIKKEEDGKFNLAFTGEIDPIHLYDDPRTETGERWFSHPFGSLVDVAAINISAQVKLLRERGLELFAFDLDDELSKLPTLKVMDQLFIVGFPLQKCKTAFDFPIYKGATVASEPYASTQVEPFLVDGKTKKGMSGSPVLLVHGPKFTPDPTKVTLNTGSKSLIGIYSGRDENDPKLYTAELGLVWTIDGCLSPVIDQSLEQNKGGSS